MATSTLWFVGRNRFNPCAVNDGKEEHSRTTLTLCKWSVSKNVIDVGIGSEFNIYTVKSEKDEMLCVGFIRETQQTLPHQTSPFYIIPIGVYALCTLYFGDNFNEYWTAGFNENGQCGVGHFNFRAELSRVEGTDNILKVRSGCIGNSTLWLKYDGSLYVNGGNIYGQLGLSMEEDVAVPTLCSFGPQHSKMECVVGACTGCWTAVACDDGTVWSAGDLGGQESSSFIQMKSLSQHHIIGISAGYGFALFLTQNGMVFGCGDNGCNQLGLGGDAENQYSEPVLIPFFKEKGIMISIRNISCGDYHCLALSDKHAVYGWGDNEYAQCGVSDGQNRESVHTPELVHFPSDVDIVRIECGTNHSGCISSDNAVFLWGDNQYRQCCDNEGGQIVWKSHCVNDYVLDKSGKRQIIDFFMGSDTTMFLLK